MPQGLQVFDSAGNIVVDVTTRLTRYIATATIAWNDYSLHSFTDDGFTTGTPFHLVVNQNNAYSGITAKQCLRSWISVSISGNTCSYQQVLVSGIDTAYAHATRDITVHFGVY